MTMLKDPYVFDFLGVGRDKDLLESNRPRPRHPSTRPIVSKVVRRVAHPRRRDGPAPGPSCAKVTHIGGSPGAQLLAAIYHSSQSNVPQ